MNERPIIMSGDNPRLILEGRQTQTRRIVKPQSRFIQELTDGRFETSPDGGFDHGVKYVRCPYGVAGDRLWVRETFLPYHGGCDYRSDFGKNGPWKASIHMPRKLSRITLEITKVRVERLQEISEDDAGDEGAPRETIHAMNNTARMWYRDPWDSLHGEGSWDKNPWVWVIEFQTVAPE